MSINTSTEAVRRLLDGVTPGPWSVGNRHSASGVFTCDGSDLVAGTHGSQRNFDRDEQIAQQDANARLIAAARELVPALTVERDTLAAEVERLREALRDIAGMVNKATHAPETADRWLDRIQEAARATLAAKGVSDG